MNKVYLLIIFLSIGCLACNTECQDCGSTSYATYYIKNVSNSKLKLIFYADSTTNFSIDSLNVLQNSRFALLYGMTGSSPQSALKFKYYQYDSMKLYDSNSLLSTLVNLKECNDSTNVMCTSNYTLVKVEEDKKGKNKGDKHSEYELIIK